MVAPHTAWRRRCTGLSLHAAASSANHSLSLSLCFPLPLLSPLSLGAFSPSLSHPRLSTIGSSLFRHPRNGRRRRRSSVRDTWRRDGGERTYGTGRVGARWKTRTRVRKRKATRREGRMAEEGWARERGREAELTRHGNGKWDATEYRWTLTGMRVRITGCHPYSAGLAAVSGQCHRYISIITFAIATSRLHSNAHAALPHCAAVVRLHISSRRPICIRYASLSRSPSLPATLQLLPIEHGSPSFRPFIQPPALRLALFSLAAHRPPCTECVRISCAAPLAWIPVIREERRGERVYVEARFRNAGQSHHRSLPKLS